MNLFNIDGPVMSFLNRAADLLILNILFMVCCLPIFTIGAATTALYYVTLKMANNEEGYIFKSFFKSFRQNFKQATLIWIPGLLILLVILLDIRIINTSGNANLSLFLVGAYAIGILAITTLLYVFPVLSKFENTVRQTVKNAMFMLIHNLPWTICIILISIVPTVIMLFIPKTVGYVLMFWLLFGFSLTALLNSFLFAKKIFKRYIPEEVDPEED